MGSKERRQREKEQRRQHILNAARKLLLKKGIAATSMNQIARNAELSVGTLYLYFKNKEELYAALQEEGLDMLYDKIQQALLLGNTPETKLKEMANAYRCFSVEHKNYFDIINYFLTSPEIVFSPGFKSRIDEHGNRIINLIEEVMKSKIDPKIKTDMDARQAALVYWSNLHGMLQFRKLQNTILKDQNFEDLYLFSIKYILKSLTEKPENMS
ncbi:MAG: TetR/AcrR family transcriptional regulator [Deltaproteobacteria bacterium]|nr:TetR/AcrR family transcriptional regulator [Deltaproteobacteria bacterium]